MSKREYTHVQALLPEIRAMVEQGKTQREMAEHFGLRSKLVVKRLLERERKKEMQGIPKARGHKSAKTLQEYKNEKKRLKMENELLRDFLQSTDLLIKVK